MYSFEGKKVLVTGASRGIGRAIAAAFAERGASVSVIYRRNKSAADETLAKLAGDGNVAIRADISQADDARDAVQRSVEALASDDIEFATGAIIDVNGASYLRS